MEDMNGTIVVRIPKIVKMMERKNQAMVKIKMIMDGLENIDVPSITIVIVDPLNKMLEAEAVAVVEQETPILIMNAVVLLGKKSRVVSTLQPQVLKF